MLLLRMVPFVERNYNMVELGPRGTGKTHLFQQVSPYAHLISGGKATVARMFVNNANGQRGLVCQYDVVCFDEISGVSFDQKDGVNIMKGYMESGEFSRGQGEHPRRRRRSCMVGNFDVDVQHQQRIGHLFGPLPPEMRDDTAFMDRIHAYLPGWDVPKLNRDLLHRPLRSGQRLPLRVLDPAAAAEPAARLSRAECSYGGALSGRDTTAVNKTVSGLLKLLYPDAETPISDEDLEWAVRLALECRRRVKEQQKRIGAAEFRNTQFSYPIGEGVEQFVSTPELQSPDSIGTRSAAAGPGLGDCRGRWRDGPGLYRIESAEYPGRRARGLLNQAAPAPLRESFKVAEQNLVAQARSLVGDRDPREHNLTAQVRALDAAKTGAGLGLPILLALASAMLQRSVRGGLIAVGNLSLGGGVETVLNAAALAEHAMEKGATRAAAPGLRSPSAARRQRRGRDEGLVPLL